MATYNKHLAAQDNPRCDECSNFDPQGFALPLDGHARAWVPDRGWGGHCEVCLTVI